MFIRRVFTYGTASSRQKARLLLENIPQVRRLDTDASNHEIKLFLDRQLDEKSLIPLLSQSGISGFRLV